MALNTTEQIIQAISGSTSPLIVLPENAGLDHYMSAAGFGRALKKLGKTVAIASTSKPPSSFFQLCGDEFFILQKPEQHEWKIELPTNGQGPKALSYEIINNKLCIYLTPPKQHTWKPEDLSLKSPDWKHDLTLCFGAQDLEACGRLFEDQSDFFYKIPILNVDHTASNEYYGHINFVDLTACALGEVCHNLLMSLDESLLDEDISTFLLTGMIAKTKSFRTKDVTPKSLAVASILLEHGAKKDSIIDLLYRTREVTQLRLWGRALARLKHDPEHQLAWTLLSRQDFLHARAGEEDLKEVVSEIIENAPEAKKILLVYENARHEVVAILHTNPPHNARNLFQPLSSIGNNMEAKVIFQNQTIVEVEKEILKILKHPRK